MTEQTPPKAKSSAKGLVVILALSVLTAILFRVQFRVQYDYGLAFIFAFPVVMLSISRGFKYGAISAIVSAALYGSILIIQQLFGDNIATPKLNAELINLGVIIGAGFILGLITEMVNFRDPFQEEATIVETFVPDEETGLYNFKSFRWMLRGEMKRVKRYSRPMSIIFLRIKNLDVYQRRYDYQQEIELFKLIGQYFRSMLREADYVGKHSDNEIGIVLPETPPEGLQIVVSRMHDTFASLSQKLARNWDEIDLVFESSTASFPKDAGNLEELIDVLDGRYKPM